MKTQRLVLSGEDGSLVVVPHQDYVGFTIIKGAETSPTVSLDWDAVEELWGYYASEDCNLEGVRGFVATTCVDGCYLVTVSDDRGERQATINVLDMSPLDNWINEYFCEVAPTGEGNE